MKTASPLIALPSRHDKSAVYPDSSLFAINEAYVQALIEAGGTPFLIPLGLPTAELRRFFDLADGILLPGGGDIEPSLYGKTDHAKQADVQADRDNVEMVLSRWAAEEGKPLLGICRGIQVITVAAGGSLLQDLPTQNPDATLHNHSYLGQSSPGRSDLVHDVKLTPSCRLNQILQTDTLPTNSLHHQAVQTIPAPFEVVGYSTDGVVEAIEHTDHPFFCAVQWHPEMLIETQSEAQMLFKAFVDACR